MNLFLIGLPGSGKTTLGEQISTLLGLTMIDTDAEIVKKEGMSIEEIFRSSGEAHFRQIEQSTLRLVSENDQQLISTGGGTPCFFDNMSYINEKGISIFIDVPVETIHKRLISQRDQKRPMLENKTDREVLSFLQQKYEERLPFYSKASITIKGNNIQVQEIIDELKKRNLIR